MFMKALLFLVLLGALVCGLPQVPQADDFGLQSCLTYCALNFDPIQRPSMYSQCVDQCKREHPKKEMWDRNEKNEKNW